MFLGLEFEFGFVWFESLVIYGCFEGMKKRMLYDFLFLDEGVLCLFMFFFIFGVEGVCNWVLFRLEGVCLGGEYNVRSVWIDFSSIKENFIFKDIFRVKLRRVGVERGDFCF